MHGFILDMSNVDLYRNHIYKTFNNCRLKFNTKVSYLLLKWAADKVYDIKINFDDLTRDENGKPCLKNSDIKFNISHCDNFVSCGISKSEIGIDIEKSRHFSDGLIKRVLSTKEYSVNHSNDDLTTIWCIKEAYSKLLGLGLKIGFNNVEVDYIISNYTCKFGNIDNLHFCIISSQKLIQFKMVNIYDIFRESI